MRQANRKIRNGSAKSGSRVRVALKASKARKRPQAALVKKLEDLRRLATVVSDSNDAIIMHDLEGKILAWNRGAQETYGYTEAEALGKYVREIIAEPDREAALTLIQNARQGEIVKSFELRRVTKDGRILDVWLTTTLLKDEKGKPVAIATTERDITERKQAETALKEKLEDLRRLATVVRDSNDAVIMHDFDGKILAWNRGAKETYGYSEAEALGKNVRDIVPEPDREAALTLIQNIEQGEVVKSFELRRLAKDGRILDVWLTTTLLRDEKGQPVAIATTERDVSERKRAAEEILRMNADLEQRVRDRTMELETANQELGRLSNHDALTGLYNRAFFDEELARLERGRQFPVSIVMADVDGLKHTNDQGGHAAGDALLKRVAQVVTAGFRTEDVAARIGGDEFAVLLPKTDATAAQVALRRLQQVLAEHNAAHADAMAINISIGVSTAEKATPLSDALKSADQKMYLEKQQRNSSNL